MNRKKEASDFCLEEQCCFQIMGRRCKQKLYECAGRHNIKSQYCEIHQREEFAHECELSLNK